MDRADIQESRRFLSSDKSAFYTFLSKKITNLNILQVKIGKRTFTFIAVKTKPCYRLEACKILMYWPILILYQTQSCIKIQDWRKK